MGIRVGITRQRRRKRANNAGSVYRYPDGRWVARISAGRDPQGRRILSGPAARSGQSRRAAATPWRTSPGYQRRYRRVPDDLNQAITDPLAEESLTNLLHHPVRPCEPGPQTIESPRWRARLEIPPRRDREARAWVNSPSTPAARPQPVPRPPWSSPPPSSLPPRSGSSCAGAC